jgi:CheY-like chemotaxis protein
MKMGGSTVLSIRRKSTAVEGSSVREPLDPSGEVVEVRQIGGFPACVRDAARKLRVLVVDDNRDCADSLSMLVNLWGNEVQTAYDGAAALAMTGGASTPDVVLLDLAMPEMDGCQMARQLRQQSRFTHTLLIAVTGWTDQAHRLLCDEAGFDHYLLKPIEVADLENLLRRARRRLTRGTDEVELVEETETTRMKSEVLSCWS